MEYFSPMLHSQMVLFLYLTIGVVIRRKNVISEEALKGLVSFVLTVALPLMIFASFDMELTPELMRNGGIVLLIATTVTVLMIPFGKLLWRKYEPRKKAVLEFSTLMPNAGFAGIPLVYAVFGPQAVFFASLLLMPQRAITWSAASVIFRQSKEKVSIKQILLLPGNLAVFIGIFYMLLPFSLPSALAQVVLTVGQTAPPLSMIAVGCMLAELNLKQLCDKASLYLSAVRLVVIPVALLFVLRPFGLDFIVVASIVVLFAMPAGVNTALFARQWDGDYIFATRCIFVSSALSIVTAPLLTLLL